MSKEYPNQRNDENSCTVPTIKLSEKDKTYNNTNVDRKVINNQNNIPKGSEIVDERSPTSENDIHFIPINTPSSVNMKDSFMNTSSFEFDDETVSAVAAAATLVNSVESKGKLEDDFSLTREEQQPSLVNPEMLIDENILKTPECEMPLKSFHYLLSSEIPKTSIVESQKSKAIKFTPNKTTQNVKRTHIFSADAIPKRGINGKKTKKEGKGTVKHSRFFKVIGSDVSKSQKSTSAHHYNPYRYPQNRSKLNPFPDFIRTRNDDISSGGSDLSETKSDVSGSMHQEPRQANSDDPIYNIPVLKPTMNEFDDIYNYIDSIKEIGRKYGAVKIIPPREFVPKFSINLESFWITTTRQLWNSSSDELNARTEFYTRLRELLRTKRILLNKLPCIDKRSIDLYRLFRIVNLRGGFQNCCNDKLWAQIGRELGFYGKISSSLSSSIKSVYQKYLGDWESVLFENNTDFLYEVRNDESKALFTKEQFERNKPEIPIILGSATSYVRNRKILADAGFCTYYDQATTQKRGITLSDSNTLPNYDFYNWLGCNSEEDINPTELKISSLYTLKQFHDKSRILKNQMLNKTNASEQSKFEDLNFLDHTFWKLLKNHDLMFETEVALHQSTTIHDSSYENRFVLDKIGNLSNTILGSSNYNNTSIVGDSLLQYTHAYSDTIYRSYLNFCMFYGSQSWSMEDHWLYNIDYHYLGDAKSVYVIPPADQEKYERLVEKYLPSRTDVNKRTTETLMEFEKKLSNFDIFNASLENQVCYDLNLPRSKPRDPKFCQFIDDQNSPKRYNNDIMFSPDLLRENGISVYHTFQEVGEMIIKFPKTYSAYFSLGTCVTESINIACNDWLSCAVDASKWLQKQQIIPQFSTFAMMLKIAHESTNKTVLTSLLPVLEKRITEELDKRATVRAFMSELTFDGSYDFQNVLTKLNDNGLRDLPQSISYNTLGYDKMQRLSYINKVTDTDLCDIFPTFLILSHSDSTGENFTMSLDYFLTIRNQDAYNIQQYNCKMVSLVSDEYFKTSLAVVKAKLNSPLQWLKRYHNILSQYSRPPLSEVKPLLDEAKTILDDKYFEESTDFKLACTEYKSLQRYVERTEEWRKKAQYYLRKNTIMLPVKEFKLLMEELKKLRISTTEVHQMIDLARKVRQFDETAVLELSKGDKFDFDKLSSLHSEGLEINIELRSFVMIDKIVRRKWWLDAVTRGPSSFEELKSLYEQGCLLNIEKSDDLKVLESLQEKLESSKDVIHKFERLKQEHEKVSYDSLLELDRMSALLPLPDVTRYTRDLIIEFKHISDIIVPLIHTIREKLLLVSSADNFSNKITTYLQFSDHIGNSLSNMNVESSFKTLCKFEEFEAESKLFKEQLIDGPSIVAVELKEVYNELIGCYKTKFNMNSLSDIDSLNHLILYDTDIVNSNNGRYCVCRQTFEGNMVECEKCQQWFHFGCIGYSEDQKNSTSIPIREDTQKFICNLCDIEEKLPSTKTFKSNNSNRLTFERIITVAEDITNKSSITNSNESAFLHVAQKYYQMFNTIISIGSIEINKTDNGTSYRFPDDMKLVRSLLEKLNGTLVCFEELQNSLYEKYKMLMAFNTDTHPSLTSIELYDTEVCITGEKADNSSATSL